MAACSPAETPGVSQKPSRGGGSLRDIEAEKGNNKKQQFRSPIGLEGKFGRDKEMSAGKRM